MAIIAGKWSRWAFVRVCVVLQNLVMVNTRKLIIVVNGVMIFNHDYKNIGILKIQFLKVPLIALTDLKKLKEKHTSELKGPLAFYKGFIPNFGQLGSWNVIMLLTLEQVIVENLSEDEIAGMKQMFKMVDTDNSGQITFEELMAGMQRVGANIKEFEVYALIHVDL